MPSTLYSAGLPAFMPARMNAKFRAVYERKTQIKNLLEVREGGPARVPFYCPPFAPGLWPSPSPDIRPRNLGFGLSTYSKT